MIKYYNRRTQNYEIEKVVGEKYIQWTYCSPAGTRLLEGFIKRKAFSRLYGLYLDRRISKPKIKKFVKKFNIDMSNTIPAKNFASFNEFFARPLKPNARPIDKGPNHLISLGDGKLLAYENIVLNQLIQVKGYTYSLRELIKNDTVANKFRGGTCLILRLSPLDYHRFHFIDSGHCEPTNKIKGSYYSVNPIALKQIEKIFCENKREWSIFHSDHFGDVLYVEVGATCVGSIIQTYVPRKAVKRGDEKGYFKYGGSTVILFFEAGQINIDPDILEQTHQGYECYVQLGEKIGTSKKTVTKAKTKTKSCCKSNS